MSLINSDSILLFWDFHDQWHIFSLSEKKKVIVSHRIGHVTDFLFITNCIEFFSFLFPISFLISLLSVLRLANQYVMFREGSKWTKKVYKFFSFHCNQLWLSIDEIACTVTTDPTSSVLTDEQNRALRIITSVFAFQCVTSGFVCLHSMELNFHKCWKKASFWVWVVQIGSTNEELFSLLII